ncbi:alpha/beta hydrolase [Scopulibacillus cellulosilyticus]|uniref:Alpha/beta hydrolase n=1 Tax=Scopulibacillus cellulosilyticus TaxID=2665665 RepID=A0ABW2Q0J9_9BACL
MGTVIREVPSIKRPKKRRRWIIVTITIIMIIVIAIMGISYYVTNALIHPARHPVATNPGAVGLPYQNISFNSREGHLKLNGWVIKAKNPTHKWIILSHGYTENRLIWPDVDSGKPGLKFMKFLNQAGFNVVTFDFRNSGSSEGKTTTVGYYEKQDLLGAIDKVKNLDHHAEIGLIGWSQGAATSLMAAPKDPSVKLVVADSPFTNLKKYLETNLPHWSHLPSFPFTPIILDFWAPILSGLDPNAVSPINAVKHFNGPILLIHSTADEAIPISNSRSIYNKYKTSKSIDLKTFDQASHTESFLLFPDRYEKTLLNFFIKNSFTP